MNHSLIVLAILLLCCAGPPSADGKTVVEGTDAPRVLLLNSYHFGYSWADSETVGILSALKERFPAVKPSIEYLDCKHFNTMRHFERQKDLLLDKYGDGYFSVVIAMDNPALEFSVRYRSVLFSKTPIIFCGINGYTPSMLGGQADIGGIIEEFDVEGTCRLMLALHPDAEQFVILHDYTTTGLGARLDAERALGQIKTRVAFHFMAEKNLREIVDTVRLLQPGTVMLCLPYTRDRSGHVVELTEIADLLSCNTRVPIYTIHQAQLGAGVVGGVMIGGRVHGEHAGGMAIRVLEGVPAGTVGIRHESSFIVAFDYKQLQRHLISLSDLPPQAVIINRPDSFYARNKELVVNTIAVFLLLLSIVALLSINIVKRKKAESALRQSAQMYKDLIEAIPDGVYKRNRDGRFIDVNPAMLVILGYGAKEELFAIEIRDLFFSTDEYLAASHDERTRTMSVFRLRKKDGSEVWVEDHASSHVDEHGTLLYHEGIMRDITERVRSERQLLQSQKLEGIGTLAGGIAHDFNNLLAMILGSAELLKSRMGAGDAALKKYVDRIIEASERGTSISRQLLIFSRPDQAELKPVSLSHIITGLQEMLQHFLPKSIAIETVVNVDSGIIMGDAGQIHQALLNLAINAGDAMHNRGMLTIREFTVPPDSIRKRFGRDTDAAYAAVSVSDTGMGMDAATLEKIFEPFFSTKEQGKGTGLGLSIVHGIVKNHRGFVDVESAPGEGTTFTIYFPSIPHERAEVKRETHGGVRRTGTLLLVDDEEILRETLSEYLRGQGYVVYSASGAREALQLFTDHRGAVDAVITDLGMPQMGGEELFRQLKKIDPSVNVIVSSGYLDGTTRESLLGMGIRGVLTKPFRIHEIDVMIRSVIPP